MATDESDARPDRDELTIVGTARRRRDTTERRGESERYQLGDVLGAGGMGVVVAARDTVLGREVAIKHMLDAAPSSLDVTRFMREAQIQARLDHPAIPPLYELARDANGRPFIVMKRLAGVNLSEIFARLASGDSATTERYPRSRLLRVLADVCLAVELAHTRGVIHRDLKPSNIMVGEFGEVYVLDWGVAKVIGVPDLALGDAASSPGEGATDPGELVGTRSYMAPEQFISQELDARIDVYSLGCVLFEILAGSVYVREETAALVPPDPHPSVRARDRDIPPELDAVCVAALARDRAQRIQTARELGASIQQYLDGDRDLALRRDIASAHYERATAALATGADSEAMREAGRALALDPNHAEAAELVSRLMLEPPRTMPPGIDHELAERDAVRGLHTKKLAALGIAGYAAVLPFVAWIGVRDWTLPIVLAAVLAICGLHLFRVRHVPISRGEYVVALVANAIIVGLYARLFSPILLAPTLACTSIMVLVASPGYRGRYFVALVASGLLAVLVPWLAELAGLISPTMSLRPEGLLLSSPTILTERPLAIQIGLIVFASSSVIVASLQTRTRFRAEAGAQQQLIFQGWRLRQLAPERTPSRRAT